MNNIMLAYNLECLTLWSGR